MSLAAFFVFILVSAVQMLDRVLDLARKRGTISGAQLKLRQEITRLLKEASALSTPSTFAQAAKLKRQAAAKEKELAKVQELNIKGHQSLYEKYGRLLMITKVLIYGTLILWFWRIPVTTVPQHLVQPFGRMLSWRGVDASTGRVVVHRPLIPLCAGGETLHRPLIPHSAGAGWNSPMAIFDVSC
ncbi:hypothetical protein ACP4OV_016887 [Aristida adscensionis]